MERLTTSDAAEISADAFGVIGVASLLPGEIDENFKIEAGNGTFVLKLAPPGVPDAHLAARHEAMERLGTAGFDYEVSRPVAATDGRTVVPLDGGRRARLVTWVTGTPFADDGRPESLAGDIGRLAGSVCSALATFEHDGLHGDYPWDLSTSRALIDRLITAVDGARRRAVIARIRDAHCTFVEPVLDALPRQAIHGDLNDLNVMIDDGRISGFIDFGDLGHSIRIGEAAIAAAYAMLCQPDPLTVGSQVMAGFASVVDPTPDEVAVAYDLVRTRLAVSACMAAHRRDSANPHLTVSETDVWDLLERFDLVDRNQAAAEFGATTTHTRTPSLLRRRKQTLGRNLSLSYERSDRGPMSIVRGAGTYLYDDRGRQYLDCVNNVAHVGHNHPAVVAAAADQLAVLNTNTRYLHGAVVDYAERLSATLPNELEVVYLTNSGSEANELALRMARAASGAKDVVVFDHGYHGNTTTLVDVSPYKFNGPGGAGKPDWVHVLPNPDPYRTEFSGADAGPRYRAAISQLLAGATPAALLAEAIIGCGGQLVPAAEVERAAYDVVRERGGICIADEVQTGFGRVGSAFWAFELHDVTPDIVTMGKPIGNGHPLGAVVTSQAVAGAFDTGMEYFNTFGGNPVSAAVGGAVLDVITDEQLQANAHRRGAELVDGLESLATKHPLIGDVRGQGLFLGIELVSDTAAKTPASAEATTVVETGRDLGVLLSIDGPHRNVIKVKPPMVFSALDVARLLTVLDDALAKCAAGRS